MPVSGDQSVDIHSWSPLFYFLKKRITEVEDENILQILFLSAGRPWELARRSFDAAFSKYVEWHAPDPSACTLRQLCLDLSCSQIS